MTEEHKNDRMHRLLETAATILLSVATIATAWCAYQSTVWASEQEFAMHEATILNREESALRNKALLNTIIDVEQFLEWANAYSTDNEVLANYMESTFSPEFDASFNAWLDLDPKNNKSAPRHPFVMPQYILEDNVKADSVHQEYVNMMEAAVETNAHSEHFTLLTVILASVLFFGGITSNIQNVKTKLAMVIGSSVLLVGSIVWLASFPMIIR